MRIFVTGASGWIGSAVVAELLEADHEVLGLARSDASAEAVTAAGAEVRRGDLADLDALRAAAGQCDGVVHLAFRHDIAFTGDFETAVSSDLAAIEALGEALAGTDRPLAVASGVAGVVAADRAAGSAAYVGDGTNRWPAVHRSDAARLVRLAVEGAPAGSVLHAVGEQGVALRDVAEAIGRGLDLPVVSITAEQAQAQFGFLAGFLGLDIPTSSAFTRELLSWEPTGPGLIADIEQGHYLVATT